MTSRSPGAKKKKPRRSGEDTARDLCQDILTGEGVSQAEVGLAYGDDEMLRQLNARYRDLDRTTDVLSFTYEDEEDEDGDRSVSGDIIVSVPRILAQAERNKVSIGHELARLLIHGSLHLCGHDHKKAGERKIMRARELPRLKALDRSAELALTRLVKEWADQL